MPSAGDFVRPDEIFTEWSPFTPTWNNFTKGNGTVAGMWRRTGSKTIELSAQFVFGSTSALAGAAFSLVLPGGLVADGSVVRQGVPAWVMDASATNQWAPGLAVPPNGGGSTLTFYGPTTSFAAWQNTSPITWATGDVCLVQGSVIVTT